MKNVKVSKKTVALLSVAVAIPGVAVAAAAGTNTADFDSIVQILTDWLTGSLGTVIALSCFAVGLAMGITQQSILAVVIGIAMALAVSFGPGVIGNIMGSGVAF